MAQRVRRRRANLQVGDVLGRSFSIWLRNFIPFTLLAGLVFVPAILYAWFGMPVDSLDDPEQFVEEINGIIVYSISLFLLANLLGLIATGALVYGVVQQLSGKTAPMLDCLRVSLTRILPVLGVGILMGILILLPVLLGLLFVSAIATTAVDGSGVMAPALMFLFGMPSLILMLMYYVAVPVAVIERPGVVASLKRSAGLTRGVKGSIFLIWLVLTIIEGFAGKLVETALAGTDYGDWVSLGLMIVWAGLGATATGVIYHDIRLTKEGVDVEELKRVFA